VYHGWNKNELLVLASTFTNNDDQLNVEELVKLLSLSFLLNPAIRVRNTFISFHTLAFCTLQTKALWCLPELGKIFARTKKKSTFVQVNYSTNSAQISLSLIIISWHRTIKFGCFPFFFLFPIVSDEQS
jgi:hypothetical protein